MTRPIAILAVVVCAVAAAVSGTSCSVHRRSPDLQTCTFDIECDGVCDHGYCVDASSQCPAPCTSCDLDERTCRVECNSNHICGNVNCPLGFDCTIRCNGASCGDIDCGLANSCDIECSGAAACHNIRCGTAPCDIGCSGPGACPSIDCTVSCRCDVSCNSSGSACPSMSCPFALGTAMRCTRQGSAGGACVSSPSGCDTCIDF